MTVVFLAAALVAGFGIDEIAHWYGRRLLAQRRRRHYVLSCYPPRNEQ
jgi:hypothetical protein